MAALWRRRGDVIRLHWLRMAAPILAVAQVQAWVAGITRLGNRHPGRTDRATAARLREESVARRRGPMTDC